MRRANAGAGRSGDINVRLGRFGRSPETVSLRRDSTVGDALSEADWDISDEERVYVNGEPADNADILEDGDVISIVAPKTAGIL